MSDEGIWIIEASGDEGAAWLIESTTEVGHFEISAHSSTAQAQALT